MILYRKETEIDAEKLVAEINSLGLGKMAVLMAELTVNYLQIPPNWCIEKIRANRKITTSGINVVLNDIWEGGNFGYYENKVTSENSFLRFLQLIWFRSSRTFRYWKVYPIESLFMPFYRVIRFWHYQN